MSTRIPNDPVDGPEQARSAQQSAQQAAQEGDRGARTGERLLPAGHAMVLGMAASGAPLGSVLHAAIELIESEVADTRCSVLLTDQDGLLRVAAAPSLPAGYVEMLADGVPVAKGSGSCGEAAATGRPVIDPDVAVSPRWKGYAGAALDHGLRACWSVPILGEGACSLGAFAVYCGTPRTPTRTELEQLTGFAQLVAFAIRQDQTSRALERSQHTDPVTGLLGRDQLVEAVEEAIARVRADAQAWAAVATVEMRRLRECNEAFGFAGGDELIAQAANRLRVLVGGLGEVFRTGGSGFAAVLTAPHDDAGRDLPEVMLQTLSAPMTIAGTAFTPSPRIGLAVASPATTGSEELLESAQLALHEARLVGGPALVPAQEPSRGRAAKSLRLEGDLRRGLAAGELVVHYQPQYALETGQIVGVEALVRWQHPERGLLPPVEFLHAVASGNLHGQLLDAVLEQSCRDAVGWHRAYPDLPVAVAVNLAPDNLVEQGMAARIERALTASGLPGGLLRLEITEEAALLDLDVAVHALEGLKALGVRVAMDDFGTGYSSLAYARQLPVDSLKVDRAFVQRIGEEPRDRAVVAAVVALANGLGMDVLAEGVETEEQRRIVRELGCRHAQGYLWSPAVPEEAIRALLAASQHGPSGGPTPAAADDAVLRADWQDRTDTFLAHVIHEARTPLTILQLHAGVLAMQRDDPDQVASAAATIERQVVALDEILTATADVYELARGTLPLHRTRVDLAALAGHVATDLTEAIPVAIDRHLEEGVVAFADASRVRQILVNLLTNAGKYAPPATTVDLVVETTGDAARVAVRDRGPGVPPDKVELIFRQFGRADASKPGLGLGLFIARQLARSHGGDLTYQPARPAGALFQLTLPLGEHA